MISRGDFDIGKILQFTQKFFRKNFVAYGGVVVPIVSIGGLCAVDVPLTRWIALLQNLIH